MRWPDSPFVLLDDGREDGADARLYAEPVEIITTHRSSDVVDALAAIRVATHGGLHAAGFITYEAGFALEPGLAGLALPHLDVPLLWFGLFRTVARIAHEAVPAWLPDPAGGWVSAPVPAIDQDRYHDRHEAVRDLIAAGDLYQANLTFRASVRTQGDPLALYAGMRTRSAAGYGAVVATGSHWLLSLSPELFFSLEGRAVCTRPMKGTAVRQVDPVADRAAAARLTSDPKQRAENLMIVDLLRNDLSRVAVPGSVTVPQLFQIETFPTLHQMTSTVAAQLADGDDAIDVLRALHPCGSITGAPKIRAMEAVRAIEGMPRGVYTGAIGRIDADGDAAFNVAIRTLVIGADGAQLGLGSGIVADSTAPTEWAECLAKGNFLASDRKFDLVETMRFDPVAGLLRIDQHLARMSDSAVAFGFAFDRHAARNDLQAATFRLRSPARVRLLLAASGAFAVEVRALPPPPVAPVTVSIVPLPVAAGDFRLRHKTTDRGFYDAARGDAFEVVFEQDGLITEGSFTNVFVERGNALLTPACDHALGGILRGALIEQGRARAAPLTRDDLRSGFLIGNSLRGLLPACLASV